MSRSFIIGGKRSAVMPRNGAFADFQPHDLAAPVIRDLLSNCDMDAEEVGELIVANALGAGGNPARLCALAAGLPQSVAGLTLDRQCCGGLDALLLADALVRSGQQDVIVAGGSESYSRRPLRFHTYADGSEPQAYHQAAFTPWQDQDPDMAEAANCLAEKLDISREEQDVWAIESHAKALAARDMLSSEITPVGESTTDGFTRVLSERLCQKAKTISGTITVANMSIAADGAAFCVIVSEDRLNKLPSSIASRAVELMGGVTLGGEPTLPGLAPVAAIDHALARAQIKTESLCVAEIMEAFAVQAIACQKGAGIDPTIVNPSGGSLARGHPIGASGAILAVRLFHALSNKKGVGLAAIAAAGGLGTALVAKAG